MIEKMKIVIMSRGRADKQLTLNSLSPSSLRDTVIAVNKEEFSDYKRENPDADIITHGVQGEGPTRKWIMETVGPTCEFLFMLDDDMDFSVRKELGSVKITKCEHSDIDDMFNLLCYWLSSGFVQVGISTRGGNNRVTEDFKDITRVMGFHGYNVEEFIDSGARFDRIVTMLDFDVTLQLLRSGRPNRVSYKYCWGQKQSNSPGGCAIYRTPSIMHEAACALADLHRGFVTINYNKKTKGGWGAGFGNNRTDVMIGWQAAYDSFVKKDARPTRGLFK
jgi:hypothetical protein